MGLDTSHDCWHGPYSAFTRFRNELARAAGYDVVPVRYDSGMTFDTAQIDWDVITRGNPGCYHGEWRRVESDPLVYLLAHSDCDGVLHPQQAGPLADRIEELLPRLADNRYDRVGWARDNALRFIAGLRRAVELGEDVDFH